MANERPPLGVSPWWFFYPRRVVELSEAISRYAEYSSKHRLIRNVAADYKAIYKWAMEIAKIAETMIAMGEVAQDGE